MKDNQEAIEQHLAAIQDHLTAIRECMFVDESTGKRKTLAKSDDGRVVEGIFNGQSMVDKDGESFSVSPNYASKSQLVEGDKLKLTIPPDGRFVYKQIAPVARRHLTGTLEEVGGQFWVRAGKKRYRILPASATFYKVSDGSKLAVVVPAEGDSHWAAVENVIEKKE